jgi:PilZ domain
MDKRTDKRLYMKLHVQLNSETVTSWGILTDISENGLFIKSNRDFAADTEINIELVMQDNSTSLLKGIVKRKVDLPEENRKKFGLGIELTEKDFRFMNLVGSLLGSSDMKTVKMMS